MSKKPDDMKFGEYWCVRDSTGDTCLCIMGQEYIYGAAKGAAEDFECGDGRPFDEWETVTVEDWVGRKFKVRVVGETVRQFTARIA